MSAVLEIPKVKEKVEIDERAIRYAVEHRVASLFYDVDWNLYARIVKETPERHNPKLFYDGGKLEIMPLPEHDNPIRILDEFFTVIAEEIGYDWENFGSSTYKRSDLRRGFEPDSSFYLNDNAELMRGKEEFDLTRNPPPDLVFEVDVTSRSVNKFSLLASFGVPEIWIFEDERVRFLILENNQYVEQPISRAIPNLVSDRVTEFIAASREMKRPEWRKNLREWTRTNLQK